MLPYRPRDTVLSRYLISWATTLVGGGLCLARSSLTSPDHHLSPAMLGTIGWLVAAVLLAQAVELPLLLPGLLRAAPLALLAGAVANGISVALSLRPAAQPTP